MQDYGILLLNDYISNIGNYKINVTCSITYASLSFNSSLKELFNAYIRRVSMVVYFIYKYLLNNSMYLKEISIFENIIIDLIYKM